ncbi:MAG: RluA family pseudouridine synthase [Spirochaetota bacterium]
MNADQLPILYHDAALVVVNKPAGLVVHPNPYTRREPTCINILGGRLHARVHVVHRLDRGTSGLLVLALTPGAARDLASQFQAGGTPAGRPSPGGVPADGLSPGGYPAGSAPAGGVRKQYLALVRGRPEPEGLVSAPLSTRDGGEPAEAATRYTLLASSELQEPVGPYPAARVSLVRLELLTGRYHQARRHLRYLDHPVLGDRRYGDRFYNRFLAGRLGGTLFLHCSLLEIRHPSSGAALRAEAGPPDPWRRAFDLLGLEPPQGLFTEPRVQLAPGGPAPRSRDAGEDAPGGGQVHQ